MAGREQIILLTGIAGCWATTFLDFHLSLFFYVKARMRKKEREKGIDTRAKENDKGKL